METWAVACSCGQRMYVSDTALGTTGKCVRCGARVAVTISNTVRIVKPASADAVPSPGTVCARCARPFRGAWDQHETPVGRLCHICANQFQMHEPQKAASKPVVVEAPAVSNPRPLSSEAYVQLTAPPSRKEQLRLAYAKFRASRYFEPVVFGAAAFLVMALVMVLPVSEYMARIFSTKISPEKAAASSKTLETAVVVVGVFLNYAEFVTWLYLGLAWGNKLPNETVKENLLAIAGVSAVITGVCYLPMILGTLGGQDSMLAAGAGVLGVGAFIFKYWVLFHLYDLDWTDILHLILVNIAVGWLFWAIDLAVFGIMAALVM
jgi:hypothetical protein